MSGLDLVAGGAGFIGSHLVEGLLAAGRRVRVLDDLSTGAAANLPAAAEALEGDAADPATAAAACAGVERVFALAARPSVPFSVEFPEEARRANLGTVEALLEGAVAAGCRAFVFSSSSAIYGDGPGLPKREDMPPAPLSPYAEHKLAGERAIAAACAAHGLAGAGLRYFNVYGPRQDPRSPYSGVISLFAARALAGEAPTVFGDGLQTRDFVAAEDVVAANLAAAAAAAPGELLVANVASGTTTDLLELWAAVWAAAHPAGGPAPAPAHGEPRAGDVRHSAAELGRLNALGWRARVPLEEGLRRTLDWLRGA